MEASWYAKSSIEIFEKENPNILQSQDSHNLNIFRSPPYLTFQVVEICPENVSKPSKPSRNKDLNSIYQLELKISNVTLFRTLRHHPYYDAVRKSLIVQDEFKQSKFTIIFKSIM